MTGASGFLGGYLVEELLRRGHEVVAMARQGSDTLFLEYLKIEIRRADLTDPESLARAVEGVEAVVHLAAYYTFTGKRDMYERVNVQGTRDLLEAMLRAGTTKMVYCSSTEAMGPTPEGRADESSPCHPRYHYGRSKLRAEHLVREYSGRGIEHVILRPSGIYGPRNLEDVSYWFIATYANSIASRFLIGDGKKVLQFVHAEDVAQGFALALESFEAAKGETYIITDSRAYSYEEIYGIMARIFGKKPARLHLPVPLAKVMVAPIDLFNRMRGKQNFLWRVSTMDTFSTDREYSIEKARRVLGYEPRHALPEGLEETAEWYRESGYIR